MSHPEYHGTQEALDEFLTVGIDLAVKVAHQRRVSRFAREEAARAQGRDAWRVQQAKQDLDHAASCARWAAVENAEWWENATPSQVLDAYREAKSYEGEDPSAASAVARINTEIGGRFGIDVEKLAGRQAPAEQLERLYAEHAATATGEGLAGDSTLGAGVDRRAEVMAAWRDYFASRSLTAIGNAGSIADIAAMSPAQGEPAPRRTRGISGQGQERDRGR